MDYIFELQDVIKRLHRCKSEYVETVPVTEIFQGQTVWNGEVEVFRLIDHPKAKVCYAWGHRSGEGDQEMRYVAVLELPPVDSPNTAVKAAIMQEVQHAREKTKTSRTP